MADLSGKCRNCRLLRRRWIRVQSDVFHSRDLSQSGNRSRVFGKQFVAEDWISSVPAFLSASFAKSRAGGMQLHRLLQKVSIRLAQRWSGGCR
jgi:hypothetical protein